MVSRGFGEKREEHDNASEEYEEGTRRYKRTPPTQYTLVAPNGPIHKTNRITRKILQVITSKLKDLQAIR
jgi:hypothetical protein